jgi:pimeloyl-ACP methyl ester carboxylesterase
MPNRNLPGICFQGCCYLCSLLLAVAVVAGCTAAPPNETRFLPEHNFFYKKDQFLNYREIGKGGKTIVLLHGFGASSRTWDDVLPYLRQPGYRLILIDLIGYGFSSIPDDGDFSMAANADAVISFIRAQKLQNYVLIGHSFGGGVVLNTALKLDRSDIAKPSALILIDSAAYNTGLPFFIEQLRTPLLGTALLTAVPSEVMTRSTLEKLYYDPSKVTDEKVRRYTYFSALPGKNEMLLKSAQQIVPSNYAELTGKYGTIDIPTLILWGAQDPALSIEGGKRLASVMPKARFVVFNQCGHNLQEERPEETAREINRFLKSIAP